jgi:hypothetical protein
MKLQELFSTHAPSVDLAQYRRTPRGMPPLRPSALNLLALTGHAAGCREKSLVEGEAALLLQYKGQDASVTSLDECDGGEVWNILQLQGSTSRKAFRVNSAFAVAQCFAEQLRRYALHPDAEVRRLTMPHGHGITNIDGARNMESAVRKYEVYASLLGLRYSQEEHKYVLDIRNAMRQLLEEATA